MLVIDDNMFKLARMQEALLKASNLNREENLKKYKKTVSEIDAKAFDDILEEIKHLDKHNHSLESELEFLENIKQIYEQLLELQARFKRICEMYGNDELKLSDLSQLNIGYIENRINAISGYLTNNQNIKTNKERIQKLSTQLINEEKKNEMLRNRLQSLEDELRYNFINAEGRIFLNEGHRSTNIINEYKELDIDFEMLLTRSDSIQSLLAKAKEKREEADATLNATKLCFELTPNSENKMFLDVNHKALLKAKYRLIMVEILNLLTKNYDSYELCKEKRKKLLSLIEDRKKCIKSLGINIPVDPFDRTKLSEQLEAITSMTDNSEFIHEIRKEMAELTTRIDEMSSENSNYLITLSTTRSLIERKIGLSDIDITTVELPFEQTIIKKEIAANQVVGIKSVPNTINMSIITQKTTSVIKRVYQMINRKKRKKEEHKEVFVPELVVVPKSHNESKSEELIQTTLPDMFIPDFSIFSDDAPKSLAEPKMIENTPELAIHSTIDESKSEEQASIPEIFIPDFSIFSDDTPKSLEVEQENKDQTSEVNKPAVNFSDIFETVTPFEEPQLFPDRIDGFMPEMTTSDDDTLENTDDLETLDINNEEISLNSSTEEMEETFWPTQEIISGETEQNDNQQPSFEDQIQMLMAPPEDNSKVRKKVA